jgi:2-methylcitrate dehydratase PrpD
MTQTTEEVVSGVEGGVQSGYFADSVAATIADLPTTPNYQDDLVLAQHCLLDWMGCALAGSAEPISDAVRKALDIGGLVSSSAAAVADVVGTGLRTTPRDAALANGTAAHALDFDDGHGWMNAHPSVSIVSAAAAAAQRSGADGPTLLAAIVAGVHAGSMLGMAMGQEHYLAGWHPTGTVGAVAAAAACARVLRLDEPATARALAIASSQSTGMRAVFGSMGKPLNAGVAAAGGLLAASLAEAGLVVSPDAIESPLGQAGTQAADWQPARVAPTMRNGTAMAAVTFKVHACCGGTHSTIEALHELLAAGACRLEDVERIDLHVSKQLRSMCRHDQPATGLQGKFSLTHTAALALTGRSTSIDSFTDAVVGDPDLAAVRARVNVIADRGERGVGTDVTVRLADGREVARTEDTSIRRPVDMNLQWARLVAKFSSLAAPVVAQRRADELVRAVEHLPNTPDASEVLRNAHP